MTEAEWLACDHPAAMLIHLRGDVSAKERADSKCSLHSSWGVLYPGHSPLIPPARFTQFVAACADRLRQLPLDEQTRRFLDTVRRHADGHATADDVRDCCSAMHSTRGKGQHCAADYLAFWSGETPIAAGDASWGIAGAMAWTVASDSVAITCAGATEDDWFEWAFSGGPPDPLYQATQSAEYRVQADLLRETIGNPFRPIGIDPAWLTASDGAVVRIAQGIDEELAFERMPVLADALEDAGCTDEQILSHLRGPVKHVPGCWVVDLVLDKR